MKSAHAPGAPPPVDIRVKIMIKRKLSMKKKEDLFSMSQNYKKINVKNYEGDLKMKDYLKNLNLESGRMIFRKMHP